MGLSHVAHFEPFSGRGFVNFLSCKQEISTKIGGERMDLMITELKTFPTGQKCLSFLGNVTSDSDFGLRLK